MATDDRKAVAAAAMKRSATLPTFAADRPSLDRRGSLAAIQSYSELTSVLSQGVTATAAAKLKKVKAISISSAVGKPIAPCIMYTVDRKSNFKATEVAALFVKHKLQGIPVWSKKSHAFLGCVELVDFARVLSDEKSITSVKPSFTTWLKFLGTDAANQRLSAMASDRGVCCLDERCSLLDVIEVMATASVRRVILIDTVGRGVACVSETDVLNYFHENLSLFTFVDGSEVPIQVTDVGDDGSVSKSGSVLAVSPGDTFFVALRKLLDADTYSIPVLDVDGKLRNTFTLSDLKAFFCTPKGRAWDMPILTYLDDHCRKSVFVDQLMASTLGVPLTRMIEAMFVEHAHVIWLTNSRGFVIGELAIGDICNYLVAESIPAARGQEAVPGPLERIDESGEMSGTPLMERRVSLGGGIGGAPMTPAMKRVSSIEALLSPMATESRSRRGITPSGDGDIKVADEALGTAGGTFPFVPYAESSLVDLLRKTQKKIEAGLTFAERGLDWVEGRGIKNQCVMITYPDCFGGTFKGLKYALDNFLEGVVGGIHILPFYPSSADRGFAPLTYKKVDRAFGDWSELEELASKYDIACDFMVNHISQQSDEFVDFRERRDASPFADLFIRYKDFFARSDGEPTKADLEKIYTRKPRAPYYEVFFEDGLEPESEKVWCTFDFEQIDINVKSEAGRTFIRDQLEALCKRGVKIIRLDAFGYATKKLGTRCFMEEPEVWDILNWIHDIVKPFGVQLLAEIHEHYKIQLDLSRQSGGNFWVYDFALPMLLLQTLYDSNCRNLHHWLEICPHNQFTTLDTHDGIGVVDVKDLMTDEESARTSENLYKYGASVKRIYSSSNFDNLDIYQINCTYYSALGNQDDWYLCARAVQIFAPGIPQIYYVGLLAGVNDIALVETTKVGRDINRHNYTLKELETECERPVVKNLFAMCRFRNNYPAFNGKFDLSPPDMSDPAQMRCGWKLPSTKFACWLDVDFRKKAFSITYIDSLTGGKAKLVFE
jgi:sucrose phosphorylase